MRLTVVVSVLVLAVWASPSAEATGYCDPLVYEGQNVDNAQTCANGVVTEGQRLANVVIDTVQGLGIYVVGLVCNVLTDDPC